MDVRTAACGSCGTDSADDDVTLAAWTQLPCSVLRLWVQASLAELTGAALLVLLGCLPAACDLAESPAPLAGALGTGLVILLLVQTFDHVSGAYFNPTVTLAAVLSGRVPASAGMLLVAAQCVGAVLGYGALLVLTALTPATAAAHAVCVTAPAPHMGVVRALVVEGALSAVLALVNCGHWDSRNRRLIDAWPLKIGLSVAGLSYAGGTLTGASMNPARSLGPAVWTRYWVSHWIYWIGPLAGGGAGALLYRRVWSAAATAHPRGTGSPVLTRRLSTKAAPSLALH